MADVIAIVAVVVATVTEVCGRFNNHILADVIAKYMMDDVITKHVMADVFAICGRWNSH